MAFDNPDKKLATEVFYMNIDEKIVFFFLGPHFE